MPYLRASQLVDWSYPVLSIRWNMANLADPTIYLWNCYCICISHMFSLS